MLSKKREQWIYFHFCALIPRGKWGNSTSDIFHYDIPLLSLNHLWHTVRQQRSNDRKHGKDEEKALMTNDASSCIACNHCVITRWYVIVCGWNNDFYFSFLLRPSQLAPMTPFYLSGNRHRFLRGRCSVTTKQKWDSALRKLVEQREPLTI